MQGINVFELLGQIVAAVGGAGVIIIAFSGFISKLWVDIYMKKKTLQYDSQIEALKKDLSIEIENCKRLNEEINHKKKVIFNFEYECYQEISKRISGLNNAMYEYFYDSFDDRKLIKEAIIAYEEFERVIDIYAVFIEEEQYDIIKNYSNELKPMFPQMALNEFSSKMYREFCQKTKGVFVAMRNYIREIEQ